MTISLARLQKEHSHPDPTKPTHRPWRSGKFVCASDVAHLVAFADPDLDPGPHQGPNVQQLVEGLRWHAAGWLDIPRCLEKDVKALAAKSLRMLVDLTSGQVSNTALRGHVERLHTSLELPGGWSCNLRLLTITAPAIGLTHPYVYHSGDVLGPIAFTPNVLVDGGTPWDCSRFALLMPVRR